MNERLRVLLLPALYLLAGATAWSASQGYNILDYGAKAAGRTTYIESYLQNLNWEMIEKRMALADQSKVWPRDLTMTVA